MDEDGCRKSVLQDIEKMSKNIADTIARLEHEIEELQEKKASRQMILVHDEALSQLSTMAKLVGTCIKESIHSLAEKRNKW
jgi:hypothetical protein